MIMFFFLKKGGLDECSSQAKTFCKKKRKKAIMRFHNQVIKTTPNVYILIEIGATIIDKRISECNHKLY